MLPSSGGASLEKYTTNVLIMSELKFLRFFDLFFIHSPKNPIHFIFIIVLLNFVQRVAF
jgi:hypothetical protein